MTYAQCIEARRLLGLSQSVVAKAIGVSVARISNYETSGHLPRTKTNQDRLPKLKAFFEQAGVEFTNGGEPGVKLKRSPE